MFKFTRNIFTSFILAMAVLACGKVQIPEGYPQVGEMQVVAITPLQMTHSTVFCDFAQWHPGAPLPQGFSAPNSRFSTVSKIVQKDTGKNLLQQDWADSDLNSKLDVSFRIIINGLTPTETYTISLDAVQLLPGKVWVMAWEILEDGTFESAMVEKYIELDPANSETPKTYTADFQPKASTKVLLATRSEKGASVLWHNIRVHKSE